ncbi:MAG: hypothetical protein RI988_353 [Pseudomonadota bacterium]|jgi:hypothetical protein
MAMSLLTTVAGTRAGNAFPYPGCPGDGLVSITMAESWLREQRPVHAAHAWARRAFGGLAVCAALGGCAAYGPGELSPGMPRAAVEASMGVPRLALPRPEGGVRLVYARGPFGRETYMVDLDATGRVQRWHQALGEAAFAAIPMGGTREELLFRLGPPAEQRPAGRLPGEIWSWRYANNDCLWFQAGLGADGRYAGGSYGTDPRCDTNDRQP